MTVMGVAEPQPCSDSCNNAPSRSQGKQGMKFAVVSITLMALVAVFLPPALTTADPQTPAGMRRVSSGSHSPPSRLEAEGPLEVESFYLDEMAVTNVEFLRFVVAEPSWRKSRATDLYRDEFYLYGWPADLDIGSKLKAQQPVTFVSYFAAAAYCRSHDKRLPREVEWEWAARPLQVAGDTEEAIHDRVLAFHSRPSDRLPSVGQTPPNRWGIRDLHGVIWEWVEDFNASVAAHDRWQNTELPSKRLCGGSSMTVDDVGSHAAFLRFSFRSELQASAAVHNLGFRCAKDIQ